MNFDPETKRRMKIMLITLGILFGVIFIYKSINKLIDNIILSHRSPIATVSTIRTRYSSWQSELKAVGSLRTILGVNVTTDRAGMIKTIYFTPGTTVKKGDILVQLNADTEIGELHATEANEKLAKITYYRDKAQYAVRAISKQTLDTSEYQYRGLRWQVASQAATVAKMTLRAPFTGRLGISYVNPGQYLNVGDKVVTLQTLDPIYIDFYLPQQVLNQLQIGQSVTVTSDSFPHKTFTGKITTIEPAVDVNTRNVKVEATLANLQYELFPGMFASVKVNTGAPQQFLTLPQTAITFNPYGDIVYIVNQKGLDQKGKPILTVTQAFVVTGETRGDQIAIVDGLKAGETVVTSGQLKLKNGTRVAINNSVVPANNPAPHLPNEY